MFMIMWQVSSLMLNFSWFSIKDDKLGNVNRVLEFKTRVNLAFIYADNFCQNDVNNDENISIIVIQEFRDGGISYIGELKMCEH